MKTKYKLLLVYLWAATAVVTVEALLGLIPTAGASGSVAGLWTGVLIWVFILKEGEGS